MDLVENIEISRTPGPFEMGEMEESDELEFEQESDDGERSVGKWGSSREATAVEGEELEQDGELEQYDEQEGEEGEQLADPMGFETSGEREAPGEVRDEDHFEARFDPSHAPGPGRESEDDAPAPTSTGDVPIAAERPRWPGRALRLQRPYLQGSDVRRWQQRMIERSWHSVYGEAFKADGVFGPQTAIVTTRFQQVQELRVDGVVGPVTWAAAWNTGPKVAAQVIAPTTAPRIFYDRAAAFDYARRHWQVVCSDGYIAGTFPSGPFRKVAAGTKFVKNADSSEHALLPGNTTIPWKQLDDCTHFISCCIGDPPGGTAGGLPIKTEFAPGPYGIVAVARLVAFLRAKKWVLVEDERSKDAARIAKLQRGDLVAYFNEAKGRYTHLALYLGGNRIACHTYCRFDHKIEPGCTWDDDWDLGRKQGFSWTFLRFVV